MTFWERHCVILVQSPLTKVLVFRKRLFVINRIEIMKFTIYNIDLRTEVYIDRTKGMEQKKEYCHVYECDY
jgi:hypothetical protein